MAHERNTQHLTATVHQGKVEVTVPQDWEGARVIILRQETPEQQAADKQKRLEAARKLAGSRSTPDGPNHLTFSREDIYRDENLIY